MFKTLGSAVKRFWFWVKFFFNLDVEALQDPGFLLGNAPDARTQQMVNSAWEQAYRSQESD